jgi:hypothetical protein
MRGEINMATGSIPSATDRLEHLGQEAGDNEFRQRTAHRALRPTSFQRIKQQAMNHPVRAALIGLGCGFLIGAALLATRRRY